MRFKSIQHSTEKQINSSSTAVACCLVSVFWTPFIEDDDQKHNDGCHVENEESCVDPGGHSGPVSRPASIFLIALKELIQVLLQISQLTQDHLEAMMFTFEIAVLKLDWIKVE